MTALVEIRSTEYLTLEDYLKILCNYGKPRLSYHGNGEWHCGLDMFVTGEGVEFKIASSFREPSPLEAVKTCHERLEKALKEIAGK